MTEHDRTYLHQLSAPLATRGGELEAGTILTVDPDAPIADGDLVVLRRADGRIEPREVNHGLRLEALVGVVAVDRVVGSTVLLR